MLSSNELSILYRIISDERQSFENISIAFQGAFKKFEYTKVAISLCILIKDNLLTLPQRLISFYILYLIKKNDKLEISPFLPFILGTIQTTKERAEQNFLLDFLCYKINYLNISVKTYIQNKTKVGKINFAYLQALYNKHYSEIKKLGKSNKKNDFIWHILYEKKNNDVTNTGGNQQNGNIAAPSSVKDELVNKYFEPNYMSFFPLNLNETNNNNNSDMKKIFDGEPVWIMPGLKHDFIWENKNFESAKKNNNRIDL